MTMLEFERDLPWWSEIGGIFVFYVVPCFIYYLYLIWRDRND